MNELPFSNEALANTPRLITFDAAGTLIQVRGSVGEIYANFAAQFGWPVTPEIIQPLFAAAFRRQPPLACERGLSIPALEQAERAWWYQLVAEVFAEALPAFVPAPEFKQFFAAIYEHFAQAEAWQVYDDVFPTLGKLRQRGIPLAVLSNFDSRLDALLRDTGLAPFFIATHISTRLGAAKPAPQVFEQVLAYHQVQPAEAWHVGDSWREDLLGAQQAGMRAFLIDRNSSKQVTSPNSIATLLDLVE